jgi:hypothetical protein
MIFAFRGIQISAWNIKPYCTVRKKNYSTKHRLTFPELHASDVLFDVGEEPPMKSTLHALDLNFPDLSSAALPTSRRARAGGSAAAGRVQVLLGMLSRAGRPGAEPRALATWPVGRLAGGGRASPVRANHRIHDGTNIASFQSVFGRKHWTTDPLISHYINEWTKMPSCCSTFLQLCKKEEMHTYRTLHLFPLQISGYTITFSKRKDVDLYFWKRFYITDLPPSDSFVTINN